MELMQAYFRRRAEEERARAAEASCAEARRVHAELASRHEQAAAQLGSGRMAAQVRESPRPDKRRPPRAFDRAGLAKAMATAFPLPASGTFPDLLEAIGEAG